MELSFNDNDIQLVEGYLGEGEVDRAEELLKAMRESMESYIDAECETTDKKQFFSFDSAFERLAYRRVENDPRELVQVPASFSTVYEYLAHFASMSDRSLEERHEKMRDLLMQAVRWNPMDCGHRLRLAEIFRLLGNKRECAQLAFSVLERASDITELAYAYALLGDFFLDEGESAAAAVGCARMGLRYMPDHPRLTDLLDRLHTEFPDACSDSDEHVMSVLAAEGVPTSPSAEIAICLIMCATDAARAGDTAEATRLTVKARDLVGQEACEALAKLVRDADAELASERGGQSGGEDTNHAE